MQQYVPTVRLRLFPAALLVLTASQLLHIDAFSLAKSTYSTTSTGPTAIAAVQSSTSPSPESLRYIANRRCLYAPSRQSSSNPNSNQPPLIIIGGTAQSVYSWEHHLLPLSKNRDVLVYECLGQGPLPPFLESDADEMAIEAYFDNVTLAYHADDFARLVEGAFATSVFTSSAPNDAPDKVDVAAFSLGGRIALAAASVHPTLIRRMHITAVAAQRDDYARVILASWRDILAKLPANASKSCTENTKIQQQQQQQQLRSFGWSTILSTYSKDFVASMGTERISAWVVGICNRNTVQGLRALLEQTHESYGNSEVNADQDTWSPASIAKRIATQQPQLPSPDERITGRLCVGSEDVMATPAEVKRLVDILGWGQESVQCFEGAGHAVPMERGREWRSDLLSFLDS